MTDPTPSPEVHWYPCDVENQPPHDQVLSLQALVTEARGRLGPGATREAILADLLDRGLAVSKADLSRVWDELA
jgi:hypothetical protein